MSAGRFFTLYYVLNFATLLAFAMVVYPPLRGLNTSLANHAGFMGWGKLTQEMELIGVLLFSYVSKYRRFASADEAVQKCIFHCKLLALILTWFAHKRYTYSLFSIWVLMYFLVKPAPYRGPSNITYLNSTDFETRVRDPQSPEDKSNVWIVGFWADWCETCQYLEAMFSMLSVKYGGKGEERVFGKVDIVRYPELAERFRIDTSGTSWQLPTIILFYKGKEIKRLPPFKSDGTVVKTTFEEKGVTKYFEMDSSVRDCSFRGHRKRQDKKKAAEKEAAKAVFDEDKKKEQ